MSELNDGFRDSCLLGEPEGVLSSGFEVSSFRGMIKDCALGASGVVSFGGEDSMELSVFARESIFFVIPVLFGEFCLEFASDGGFLCGDAASNKRDRSLGFLGVEGLDTVVSQIASEEISTSSLSRNRSLTG